MITYSGRSVWPFDTKQEGVPTDIGPSLEDIAVGLGRQSRFAGQTREFYTVLCHSLVGGAIARELWPGQPMLRRWLLLHDGHESVLSDTPTTWKTQSVRLHEAELDLRIAQEHGLEPMEVFEYDQLKQVDYACLAAEAHVLGHVEAEAWWPKSRFGPVEALAFDFTMRQLQAGNPVRYLEPRNAIAAFLKALA